MNYRNKRVLAHARDQQCQGCGSLDGTVVAAHSNSQRHGKGMGIKAHDIPAYLCSWCHEFVDRSRTASNEERQAYWMEAARKSYRLFSHLLDEEGQKVARQMGVA